jgi:hypothetical protein
MIMQRLPQMRQPIFSRLDERNIEPGSSVKTLVIAVGILLWGIKPSIFAQDAPVNENDMFSDTSSVVASSTLAPSAQEKPKTVGMSGVIDAAFLGSANRDWMNDLHRSDLTVTNFIVGNLMLDIRLPQGVKAFANLETEYLPLTSSVMVGLREMFVDANVKKKVFLRLGKQVLQWGRCQLWNPTDLINVEKKLFIQKIGYREGAYGVKMHIPFGTAFNIYGFLDTKNASSVDSLALAGKFEFLIGNTEMAFSVWDKKDFHPVAGYDVSTRVLGLDILGEVSVSHGANSYSLVEKNGLLATAKSEEWQTKACVDAGRSFDFFSFPRALTVTGSFYYNGPGYGDNFLSDTSRYRSTGSIPLNPLLPPGISGISPAGGGVTKRDFLVENNLYEQHNFSQYYAALFTSLSRLFLTSLGAQLNAVYNLRQNSMILSGGVTYTSLNEFFTQILVSGYIGKENTEYTFQNQAMTFQVTAGLTF